MLSVVHTIGILNFSNDISSNPKNNLEIGQNFITHNSIVYYDCNLENYKAYNNNLGWMKVTKTNV